MTWGNNYCTGLVNTKKKMLFFFPPGHFVVVLFWGGNIIFLLSKKKPLLIVRGNFTIKTLNVFGNKWKSKRKKNPFSKLDIPPSWNNKGGLFSFKNLIYHGQQLLHILGLRFFLNFSGKSKPKWNGHLHVLFFLLLLIILFL